MAEDDRRPVPGDTTPLSTGRDRAAGQGRQGGGVVQGMAEEGRNLEGRNQRD